MATRKMPPLELARQYVAYEPTTGIFTFLLTRPGKGGKAGERAGSKTRYGYRMISVKGFACFEHRLAWLFGHGELPPDDMTIDHINGVRDDNRLSNLRLATMRQNSQNARPKGKSSAYKGVSYDTRTGKWVSTIRVEGRHTFLGYHASEIDAARAYDAAASRYFGAFARLNTQEAA